MKTLMQTGRVIGQPETTLSARVEIIHDGYIRDSKHQFKVGNFFVQPDLVFQTPHSFLLLSVGETESIRFHTLKKTVELRPSHYFHYEFSWDEIFSILFHKVEEARTDYHISFIRKVNKDAAGGMSFLIKDVYGKKCVLSAYVCGLQKINVDIRELTAKPFRFEGHRIAFRKSPEPRTIAELILDRLDPFKLN